MVELTIRERQVLTQILGGESNKTAANQLGLSEHTVCDHVKSIYRKLEVGARSELMTWF